MREHIPWQTILLTCMSLDTFYTRLVTKKANQRVRAKLIWFIAMVTVFILEAKDKILGQQRRVFLTRTKTMANYWESHAYRPNTIWLHFDLALWLGVFMFDEQGWFPQLRILLKIRKLCSLRLEGCRTLYQFEDIEGKGIQRQEGYCFWKRKRILSNSG